VHGSGATWTTVIAQRTHQRLGLNTAAAALLRYRRFRPLSKSASCLASVTAWARRRGLRTDRWPNHRADRRARCSSARRAGLLGALTVGLYGVIPGDVAAGLVFTLIVGLLSARRHRDPSPLRVGSRCREDGGEVEVAEGVRGEEGGDLLDMCAA
jgi:hypothetical protein